MTDDFIKTGPDIKQTALSKVAEPAAKTRDALLQVLDEGFSNYDNIGLTDQESARLKTTIRRLQVGSASFSVLHCAGAACPFAARCPLVQMKTPGVPPVDDIHGKAPVGKDCILEASLLRDSLTSYMQEYEVDPANYTELNIVTELAEIEVLLWRCNMQLSSGDNALLVIDQTIGFDRHSGQAITQQQVSPVFEQKQKLANRKSRLIKLMVGDRQEKYKKEAALKQKPTTDASTQMADMKKQLQSLQNRLKAPSTDTVIDADVISPEDFMLNPPEKK